PAVRLLDPRRAAAALAERVRLGAEGRAPRLQRHLARRPSVLGPEAVRRSRRDLRRLRPPRRARRPGPPDDGGTARPPRGQRPARRPGSQARATACSTCAPAGPTAGTPSGPGRSTTTGRGSRCSTGLAIVPAATPTPSPAPSASTPSSVKTKPTCDDGSSVSA